MTGNAADPRHARIAWRCRRGMRELDLLLGQALAPGLGELNEDELDGLERLLEQPDQDILGWLTGARGPDDAALADVVAIVRERIHWRAPVDE